MAYKVMWQVPHKVLYMELEGQLSLDDFMHINHTVISHLDRATENTGITLLINAVRVSSVPREIQPLRASQTYLERRDLKHILVVTNNKMVRLMMLLTFNLCRPALRFLDDLDQAYMVLRLVQPTATEQSSR